MRKSLFIFACIFVHTIVWADTPGNAQEELVQFTPPPGWRFADVSNQLNKVRTMVVGTGKREVQPSMNLMVDSYPGTKKEFLKFAKALCETKGEHWKDLGTIQTEAGNASLLQVQSKTEWGDLQMLQVVLLKEGKVYILTAAALKEEFPQFYSDFFRSLRTLRIEPKPAS